MVKEKVLIDTLHDEVTQLLDAHREIDKREAKLLEELSTLPEHGAVDEGDLIPAPPISQLFEVEREELLFLEELAEQIDDPDKVWTTEEIGRIHSQVNASREQRRNGCSNPQRLYRQVKQVFEKSPRHSENTKILDSSVYETTLKEMQTHLETFSTERIGLTAEIERLEDKHNEHLEAEKYTQELLDKITEIEAAFKSRSRFGAWLCNAHADDELGEVPDSAALQMDELRKTLNDLQFERRMLEAVIETNGLTEEESLKGFEAHAVEPS